MTKTTNPTREIFGYLPDTCSKDLVVCDNNIIYLHVDDDFIHGKCDTWYGFNDHVVVLQKEQCKDMDTLLQTLKNMGVLHKETISIQRSKITNKNNTVVLYGLIDKLNPNIKIVYHNIGRGYKLAFLKDISHDEIVNSLMHLGYDVSYYEKIMETDKGILIQCRVNGKLRPFLIKDGKAKNAGVSTLLHFIKKQNEIINNKEVN